MAILRCPTCGREFDAEQSTALPFCSSRCRLIDLGRWLNEEQRLLVEREEEDEEG
ncbi:MAG: DNA gyrase inhibitor YacG [Planctomycetota bacterium]|nr:DNA gyrase inhibitor YacG [Planctomycetota bacterium]